MLRRHLWMAPYSIRFYKFITNNLLTSMAAVHWTSCWKEKVLQSYYWKNINICWINRSMTTDLMWTYSSEKKFCPNLFSASFRYFLTMPLPCLWKYLNINILNSVHNHFLQLNTCQSFFFVQSQVVVHLSNLSLNADNNLNVNTLEG